jgi:hypothetical protein
MKALTYQEDMMKKAALIAFLAIIVVPCMVLSGTVHDDFDFCFDDDHGITLDDVRLKFKHDDLIISPKCGSYEDVEITDDYHMYINGERIRLNSRGRSLIRNYYKQARRLRKEAMRIGMEGAKVGIKGAEVGIYALAGLVKTLSSDYDKDDFERDIERKARRVEKEAKKLEKKAERVEKMADDLEDLHHDMRRHIKDLRRLDWF